jgi:hypothetical protein
MSSGASEGREGSHGELQVPRVLRPAELLYGDGRVMHGRVFLPVAAGGVGGAVRVGDWLEEPSGFFPFLPDGEGRPLLLNKAQLVVLTVSTEHDPAEAAADAGGPRRRVHIECGPLSFEGEVAIDLPPDRQRVLDLLNHPGSFLAVRGSGRRYFVRKRAILRVGEPARPSAG